MRKLLSGAVALLAISTTGFSVQAAETDYTGLMACGHATGAMLTTGPDVVTYTSELWEIVPPDNPIKVLQKATLHCRAFVRVVQGKTTSLGACSWTDSAGDNIIGETSEGPDKAPTWTFLSGTGKWKGVSGGGTYTRVAAGKPNPDGSIDVCTGMSGKWVLPQ